MFLIFYYYKNPPKHEHNLQLKKYCFHYNNFESNQSFEETILIANHYFCIVFQICIDGTIFKLSCKHHFNPFIYKNF